MKKSLNPAVLQSYAQPLIRLQQWESKPWHRVDQESNLSVLGDRISRLEESIINLSESIGEVSNPKVITSIYLYLLYLSLIELLYSSEVYKVLIVHVYFYRIEQTP